MSTSDSTGPLPDLDSASVLAMVLESVPSGVLIFDSRGQLRVASAPLAAMFGMEPQQLRELQNFDNVVAELAPRCTGPEALAARWRQHLAAGEAAWDELELASPPRKILERFAQPILGPAGQRAGWLEVYRDVTGERLMESRLFHTERMVALGQMVSSVAHEINNPLTTIFGYAQLLLARCEDSWSAVEAERILQEAERANRIARNLLLFARGAKVERSAASLNQIVQRTMALRAYELSLSGIRVHLNLTPNLPPILADASQLQQVVLNLVTNAEQAIGPGTGRGRIWLRTRRVSAERVALDITDDGPGIDPELLARVFDPFFTTKPLGVGTGIGLSIVRGILHEHGGEVSVQSQLGRGAMFTIELVVASTADLALPQPLVRSAAGLLSSPRPVLSGEAPSPRILVVEDEPTVASLIADLLTEEGYSVDTVLDSRQGLGLLQRKPYDLLICDLQMPHLDGRSLYRELSRLGNPLAQRLVFVTGDMLSPRTVEFLESNAVPCLAKPFLVEELKEFVHRALSRTAECASAQAAAAGEVG